MYYFFKANNIDNIWFSIVTIMQHISVEMQTTVQIQSLYL